MHEIFLAQNIFRDSKKIFSDFSVGMELENEKTETRHHFCSKINVLFLRFHGPRLHLGP